MKIFKSLGYGARRALRSWKCIIVIWFISLLIVSLYVVPAKGIMKAGFGNSTITELLRDGINIDVISDLEQYFYSILSYFSSGFFLLLLLGILIHSFLAGGLFKSLTGAPERLSISCFFRASAKYFWYFIGLYFLIMLIIIITGLLIIGLPVGLKIRSGNASPGVRVLGIVCGSLFLIVLMILLLVADYSRAWLIAAEKPTFFKAFGFGFSETFRRFRSSFPVMLIIMIIMVLDGWLVSTIIGTWKPATGAGVFLLFIVSQFLFFIKILLRALRYGSVTALMEMNKQVTP
jgi:hypothetical protein